MNMHISDHIDYVWTDLLDQVLDESIVTCKQGEIREMLGVHVILNGAIEQFCLNPRRRMSPIYASAELLWYLGYSNNAEMILEYAPQYKIWCDERKGEQIAYGAYGDRLQNNINWYNITGANELETAIQFLQERPTTKQCVLSLWRPDDIIKARYKHYKDIPCTIAWQFMIRNKKLHMLCYMRSCDLWKGFLYDSYVNTTIQRWVAARLGLVAGDYHHIMGSAHLYERNLKAAMESVQCPVSPFVHQDLDSNFSHEELFNALNIERRERVYKQFEYIQVEKLPMILHDALICCDVHYRGSIQAPIQAHGLKMGMGQFLEHRNKDAEAR